MCLEVQERLARLLTGMNPNMINAISCGDSSKKFIFFLALVFFCCLLVFKVRCKGPVGKSQDFPSKNNEAEGFCLTKGNKFDTQSEEPHVIRSFSSSVSEFANNPSPPNSHTTLSSRATMEWLYLAVGLSFSSCSS